MTLTWIPGYTFELDEAERVIRELQALPFTQDEDYDEAAVLEVVRGIGKELFFALDDKPGWFGYNPGQRGEWHWKLRRARNSAPGFFDAINA